MNVMSKKYVRAEIELLRSIKFKNQGIIISRGGTLKVCDNDNFPSLYKTMWTPQHMYITSKERIRTGDVVYHNSGYVSRVLGFNMDAIKLKDAQRWTKDCRKVIATDDDEYNTGYKENNFSDSFCGWNITPNIPKSFINDFCNEGGPRKVMVQFNTDYDILKNSELDEHVPYKISLDANNTIVIKPAKVSWGALEVKGLMWMSWRAANAHLLDVEHIGEEFEEWFKTITL